MLSAFENKIRSHSRNDMIMYVVFVYRFDCSRCRLGTVLNFLVLVVLLVLISVCSIKKDSIMVCPCLSSSGGLRLTRKRWNGMGDVVRREFTMWRSSLSEIGKQRTASWCIGILRLLG